MAMSRSAAGKQFVSHIVKNGIAVIKLDLGPQTKHNLLNEQSAAELFDTIGSQMRDHKVQGIVMMSGKPTSFIAGADTKMFGTWKTSADAENNLRAAKREFAKFEKCDKPIVTAIMGPCMGAGLELALSTHWRVAVAEPKTQIALPEIKLGLLPAAGGTQRVIKIVPLYKALDFMLTGRSVGAEEAKKMGIVDQVVLPLGPGLTDPLTGTHRYLEEVAIKAAQDIVSRRVEPCKRRSEWPWWDRVAEYGLCNVSPARNAFLNYIGRQEAKKSGGHPAPAATRIIDCVRVGLRDGEADGYEAENKHFGELLMQLHAKMGGGGDQVPAASDGGQKASEKM